MTTLGPDAAAVAASPGPPLPASSSPSPSSRPVALITGGHSGLGLYASQRLALLPNPYHVLVASRTRAKAEAAIAQSERDLPELKGRMEWIGLDLTDLAGVRRCAEEVVSGKGRLDLLVCCACLHGGGVNYEVLQESGLDQMVCTNYVGHALLIELLLPAMDRTACAFAAEADVRVLLVTSDQTSAIPKGTRFESVEDLNRPWSSSKPNGMVACRKRYGASKVLLNLLATHLTSTVLPRLPSSSSDTPGVKPILALAVDPGWTSTPSALATVPRPVQWVLGLFLAPLATGGDVLLFAGTAAEVRSNSGEGRGEGWGGALVGRGGRRKMGEGIGKGEDERAGKAWEVTWGVLERLGVGRSI